MLARLIDVSHALEANMLRHSREGGNPGTAAGDTELFIATTSWIPAFAGMTDKVAMQGAVQA